VGFVGGLGYGGSRLATDYAKSHGWSASNQMMAGDFGGLGGSLVGGGMLAGGARLLGGTPVVEPVAGETTPVVPEGGTTPLVDRAQLNPEDIFPGQQSGNNCAPQSAQQIVRVGTGSNISEADMAASAQANAGYDPAVGTPANRVPDILNANGVPARTMPNTPESIQGALDQGQGVVSMHRPGKLWPGDPNFVDDPNYPISPNAGHAVNTIDTVRDPAGNVTGYVINDTGLGTAGRVVPAAQYEGSLMDNVPATVTTDPIYTPYQPAEATPEGLGGAATGEGDTSVAAPSGGKGSLTGDPTPINPDEAPENIQALTRENESAQTLADSGYNVEQNPPPPGNGKNPDYRIDTENGPEYYDNYAPTTPSARNAGKVIQGKVTNGQADRIVANLDDTSLTSEQLQTQLRDWNGPATPNLKEVLTIKNGQVVRIYP